MRILPTHQRPRSPAKRFPGHDWLVGWIVLSLTFCPTFPGGRVPTLPLAQMALASGEYGDGGYYGGTMGDPGYMG